MTNVTKLVTFNEHAALVAINHLNDLRARGQDAFERMQKEGNGLTTSWGLILRGLHEDREVAEQEVLKLALQAKRVGVDYLMARARRAGDVAIMRKVLTELKVL